MGRIGAQAPEEAGHAPSESIPRLLYPVAGSWQYSKMERQVSVAYVSTCAICFDAGDARSSSTSLLGFPPPGSLNYLTPPELRKGKGGRQPALDPRLDPSVDPKRAKRILANRLSAAKSKMKQKSHVDVRFLVVTCCPLWTHGWHTA